MFFAFMLADVYVTIDAIRYLIDVKIHNNLPALIYDDKTGTDLSSLLKRTTYLSLPLAGQRRPTVKGRRARFSKDDLEPLSLCFNEYFLSAAIKPAVECQTVGVEPHEPLSLCFLVSDASLTIPDGHLTLPGSNPAQRVCW